MCGCNVCKGVEGSTLGAEQAGTPCETHQNPCLRLIDLKFKALQCMYLWVLNMPQGLVS